jgi:hypothetical protein
VAERDRSCSPPVPVVLPPGRSRRWPPYFSHQQAPTGVETDVRSLKAAWKATLKVKCPHCGEVHEISVRETYINGVLQDPTTGYARPSRAH